MISINIKGGKVKFEIRSTTLDAGVGHIYGCMVIFWVRNFWRKTRGKRREALII